MSQVPLYAFYQKDAADRLAPKKFCDVLIATGRFWRDEHNLISLKIADGDFIKVENKRMLREIIEDGEVLRVVGDVDQACFDTLWLFATSRKWTFPRLNPERPWNPSVRK